MRPLLPLYRHPARNPADWDAARRLGPAATVVVNIDNGPGPGRDAGYARATAELATARVPLLGYVDLDRGARPLAGVLADLRRWTAYPVAGVFLDRAPTEKIHAGPVALAVRVARRAGLAQVTLNPGRPADPVYRDLGARLCVFDGPWSDYQRWDGTGAMPGDGHLVYGVPAADIPDARRLAVARQAGFGLVTRRTESHEPTPPEELSPPAQEIPT